VKELLKTKLFIPSTRSKLVSRSRLTEKLNGGLGRKLTLISAPAGFGKTTIVSEWVQDLDEEYQVAWFSLGENDNVLARFLSYFVASLQGHVAHIGGEVLEMLQLPQLPKVEALLTPLLNEITSIRKETVFVLDDFHLIEDLQVHQAMDFLVENSPQQFHLVIVTREDPPLPLARLSARNQLTELRAKDLRFTKAESAEFLTQVMGLNLSVKQVSVLEERTEGWIAGLQLAAISMQGLEDVTAFIETFTGSHRLVLDYLIEEVLVHQSDDVQDFLLKTSILDKLNGSLCDTLTGQKNGQRQLERLEQANLFVVPLDEEREWFRYHHLFSNLLRQRVRKTFHDEFAALHLKASKWYFENNFSDDAIEHAILSKDYHWTAELIEASIDHALLFGEQNKLKRWLSNLPETEILQSPQLCVLKASSLFAENLLEEACYFLDAVKTALDSSSSTDTDKFLGRALVVRSSIASYRGDNEKAEKFVLQALKLIPESDVAWRWSALDNLGSMYGAIDAKIAYKVLHEALEVSKRTHNQYLTLLASMRLVVVLRELGNLDYAIEICEHQLKIADENALSKTALVGWLYTLWGEILAEKNEIDSALTLVSKGIELTKRGNDLILLGSSYLSMTRVLFSSEDWDRASKFIREIREDDQDITLWVTHQFKAWQARIWIMQKNLDAASLWAEACEVDVEDELDPIHDFDYGILSRILIVKGDAGEALKLLARLFDTADAGHRTSKTIEILNLQALAMQSAGKMDEAIGFLERALTLAEPGGFVRVFLDEGPPMAHLLYEALSRKISPDYVQRLLRAFPVEEPEKEGTPQPQDSDSHLIEPLSEREIEILQLIAEGLTNENIGSKLYLSLNTVKAHTRNIYGKLGVNSRTQAVAKARALGLILSF